MNNFFASHKKKRKNITLYIIHTKSLRKPNLISTIFCKFLCVNIVQHSCTYHLSLRVNFQPLWGASLIYPLEFKRHQLQRMQNSPTKCRVCDKDANLKSCAKCKLVEYCSRECQLEDWNNYDHKVLCIKAPKVTTKSREMIENFDINAYHTRHVGVFMSSEEQARRGEILEEEEAQATCYDAMEMYPGTMDKLQTILNALKKFPLSTEAWSLLGSFYRELEEIHPNKSNLCSQKSLEMYDTAIQCARILNPEWTNYRQSTLEWGLMYTRPYLRALCFRSMSLHKLGRTVEAVDQAKKILKLNPSDNQGIRKLLCNWYLEISDTEGILNLFRSFNVEHDGFLAYSDVLLQFLRWKKDDIFEDSLKKTLYKALKANPYIPSFLIADTYQPKKFDYLDCGGPKEAQDYATKAYFLWRKYPGAVEWLKSCQYFNDRKVPSKKGLIELLRSGVEVFVHCTHTDKRGFDETTSTIKVTQKRKVCIGNALHTFEWPSHLNKPHKISNHIWMHNNDFEAENKWRITLYGLVKEVPYWKILLEFVDDDEDLNKTDEDEDDDNDDNDDDDDNCDHNNYNFSF